MGISKHLGSFGAHLVVFDKGDQKAFERINLSLLLTHLNLLVPDETPVP
jgi:hypothetical protein